MQLARLIEPREARSIGAKAQADGARALQIERRLSKDEILGLYLALAPYGGNLEGIRAASLGLVRQGAARRLELGEAALLVALPQLPERRRPDRNPAAAENARDRVLARMVSAGLISDREAGPRRRARGVPSFREADAWLFAAHCGRDDRDFFSRRATGASRHQLSLRAGTLQRKLEHVAGQAAERPWASPRLGGPSLMADAVTGEVAGARRLRGLPS